MMLMRLFYEFFKTGLFAIGGGAATIPFLSSLSDTTGWFTKTDLANMIAVSESTPGAIGVNMSSYVGFEVYGMAGCVIATLGLVAPSVIIIIIIAGFLKRFSENSIVETRPCLLYRNLRQTMDAGNFVCTPVRVQHG